MREKYLITSSNDLISLGMMYNDQKQEVIFGTPGQFRSALIAMMELITLRAIDKVTVKTTKKNIIKYFFKDVDRKVYKLWHNRLKRNGYKVVLVDSLGKIFGNNPILK